MNHTTLSYPPRKAYSDVLEPLEAFLLQELAQLIFRIESLLLLIFATVFPLDTGLFPSVGRDIVLI